MIAFLTRARAQQQILPKAHLHAGGAAARWNGVEDKFAGFAGV